MSESTSRGRNNLRKAPKLRASCDACSSAKVRCTQTKPSCARCSKHEVPCVYGLSRRSGKRSAESYQAMRRNAEREVAASPDSELDFLDGPFSQSNTHQVSHCAPDMRMNMDLLSSPHMASNQISHLDMTMNLGFMNAPPPIDLAESPSEMESLDSASHDQYPSSPDSCPDLPEYLKQQLEDWAFDNMFMPPIVPTPDVSPRTSLCPSVFEKPQPELQIPDTPQQQFVYTSLQHIEETPTIFKPSSIYSTSPISESDYIFTPTREYSDSVVPSIENESYFDSKSRHGNARTSTTSSCSSCSSFSNLNAGIDRGCRCNEMIITHLAIMPDIQANSNHSYDIELGQLQEALKLGSEVLNCICAGRDYAVAISMSLLSGRIVSVIDRLCQQAAREDANPPPHGQTHFDNDRYSIGMYQIAKQDERRLKQEMLGLQIQKAELVVMCSGNMVGRLQQPDTQAFISQKLFSFLGEKIRDMKREWEAANGEA